MSPNNQNEVRRLLWLDTLRGGAASAVVFGHYAWIYIDPTARIPFDPGIFGVSVFFLISGYIIPRSVAANHKKPLLHFIFNRISRLLPVYWFSVLITALMFQEHFIYTIANLTGLQKFVGVENLIGATWTLQVEFAFYCWICIAIVFNRVKDSDFLLISTLSMLFTSCVFGAVRFFIDRKAPVAIPIGVTTIFLGYWIYLFNIKSIGLGKFCAVVLLSTFLLIITFFMAYSKDWGYRGNPWRFIISNGLAGVVFFYMMLRPSSYLRVFVWVSSFSYPLYLLHQPMQELSRRMFPTHLSKLGDVAAIVFVFLASMMLHKALEQPCTDLGRRISQPLRSGVG